jgi:Cyclin, N-terminal domain
VFRAKFGWVGSVFHVASMIRSSCPLISPVKSRQSLIHHIGNIDHHESAIERFHIMHRQENEKYRIHNLTPPDRYEQSNMSSNAMLIDIANCRYKVATWCNELMHFCNMSQETVELAMSCLDRFMFTTSTLTNVHSNELRLKAWTDPTTYQLASMTSFYMAVKVQEPAAFNPEIVANKLSRGTYTVQQIEQMEIDIIDTLQWYMNPPTITAVVREFMLLLKPILTSNVTSRTICTVDSYMDRKLQSYISRQIHFSVVEYSMLNIPVHIKAYCIILNALEMLNVSDNVLRATGVYLRTLILRNSTENTDVKFCSPEESYRIRNILFQSIMPEYTIASPPLLQINSSSKSTSPSPPQMIDTSMSASSSVSSLRSCTAVAAFNDILVDNTNTEVECRYLPFISSKEDDPCCREGKRKAYTTSNKRKKCSENIDPHILPRRLTRRPLVMVADAVHKIKKNSLLSVPGLASQWSTQ